MSYYFEVIPFGQIQESLTYKYSQILPLGCIVQVPLRGKIQGGVVLAQTKENDIQFDLKKILSIDARNTNTLNALGYSLIIHTKRYE